jgi:hypothetical protein
MSKKKFVLRIDEKTMELIERWAVDEFRSTNGQIEWILVKALKESGRKKRLNIIDDQEAENDPAS